MKSTADNAQMESEDVAAVKVRKTGDRDMRAKNIMMDGFNILRSEKKEKSNESPYVK